MTFYFVLIRRCSEIVLKEQQSRVFSRLLSLLFQSPSSFTFVVNYPLYFATMAPPSFNLEPFKDEIADLFLNQNQTWSQIAEHLREQGVDISTERLRKRALQAWGLKRRSDPGHSTHIIERARELFEKYHLDDKTMLQVLHHEGFHISDRSLKSLRKKEGLYRTMKATGAITDAELKPIVAEELETGGIKGYGRTMLHSHFRNMGVMASR